MSLSPEQISTLLSMIASSESDEMDCDGCFEHLAEFAEIELTDRGIPEAMRAIRTHLEQCPCCHDEFNALMEALNSLQDNAGSPVE